MLNTKTAHFVNVSHRLKKRDQITPGIVHLGLGAFHRAHQAVLTDEFMAISGQRNWGIISANIVGGQKLVESLKAQDNLFTITETDCKGKRNHKLISSIIDSMYAAEDRRPLIDLMSQESTRIVSLTVTEKGYCTNLANGKLLLDNPLIEHDLQNPEHPKSAIGIIVAALAKRRAAGICPFTVLSCDNMPDNGKRTRNAVLQFASLIDQDLARWIGDQCTFPCTMVDRIVPAATPESLAAVAEEIGEGDNGAIVCEAFRQWVIEDNFVMGRPDWDDVPGVIFVADVRPYEEMKLRMLNGSHSFLAYLGYLGGYPTISEAMSDSYYYAAVRKLMLEVVIPTLSMQEGTDLQGYAQQLIDRFCNPGLAHRTWQIAMDGSQKIPQRWLNTIRWHLENGGCFTPLALAVAGWMKYVSAVDEHGNPIDIRDPMAAELKLVADIHKDSLELRVKTFLSVNSIFGEDLPQNEHFVKSVLDASQLLAEKGAQGAVASLTE
ncbi:mannitol dehydrogenase family protein [Sansalvadorimonas sp. 2012CJ34-2]|uniref:Mannitol dehydrogenase family protein n=1 Tax=Parendozoicomonas callyspongiae TaxID=2942213 RepID=A0ABT0PGD7_9GAMM|nr:mannitol dehydrogenase family protein [Sansalvadorimonas sp. 2012CJ34-2]MCL6270419.1 mannitol dehydrogenase family protein [Sansalvadorimonas sp. 2012CJ34-2]